MVKSGSWFTDLRKAALIASIATLLDTSIPGWNAMRSALAIESTHPSWKWWVTPFSALAGLLLLTLPAFYFALYRSEGSIRLPRRLRLLSLAAALTLGILTAAAFWGWAGSLGLFWKTMQLIAWQGGATGVLVALGTPIAISNVSVVLTEFSNAASLLLLIALYRQTNNGSLAEVSPSRLLRFVTKITVIWWALWLALLVLGVVLTPYLYFHHFQTSASLGFGRTPPPLAAIMARAIRKLLAQFCLFAAPYIVYKGSATSSSVLD